MDVGQGWDETRFRRRTLCLGILACLTFAGCGGGPGTARRNDPPLQRIDPLPTIDPRRMHLDAIGVPAAHTKRYAGDDVRIGLIDTGADPAHPVLEGRIAWSRKYLGDDVATPDAADPYGHGTVMAQLIAGRATNDFAGGVAPGASIYSARTGRDIDGRMGPLAIAAAYSDLLRAGVRLFNNSYAHASSITDRDVATDAGHYRRIFAPAVIAHDALLIFAAGNQSRDQPSLEAGLPALHPELEQGWLAVVNVSVDAYGNPGALHPSSNACGVAAAWCLAAPGVTRVAPIGNTRFTTGQTSGTSSSAALVTGAAAVVMQAFPYFTGDQVRQTLLSTAKPIGDPALFGYGLLDVGRAVRGPARFDWGDFATTVTTDSIWSNDIAGQGGLVKRGPATLTMSGDNHYRGATDIHAGTLNIDGTIRSAVHIFPEGQLGGTGAVHGNVVNKGQLAPSGGTFVIHGDYLPVSSGVLSIAPGQKLKVDGYARLAGSTLSLRPPAVNYVLTARETLLEATHGVEGVFGAQRMEAGVFYDAELEYSSHRVDARIARRSIPHAVAEHRVLTPTMQSTANGVEAALTHADAWTASDESDRHAMFLSGAASFLRSPDIATALTSLDSLSAEAYASNQGFPLEQGDMEARTLATRMDALVQGDLDSGVWGDVTVSSGRIAQHGVASGQHNGTGTRIGVDTPVADTGALGLSLTRHRGQTRFDRFAGNVTSHIDTLAAYGRAGSESWYVAANATASIVANHVRRDVLLGGQRAVVSAGRRDTKASVHVEAGVMLRSGSWRATPFVVAAFDETRRAAFTEDGANGFGVAAPTNRHRRSTVGLGGRIAYRWSDVVLEGYGLWQWTIRGRDPGFDVSFVGAPASMWRVHGASLPATAIATGVSIAMPLSSAWQLRLGLDVRYAQGTAMATTGSLGLRYDF
ncbi:outer membrane autotransporter protein [Luteibacter rhizovicinus]|uniref:Outer membrane autotransporter protein n=1 Tax=Luteibacter rhizovicinus TaxID=242606 RepID=A0A4R3YXQ3_9GAMM|nr:autotransporter serine protease [Luteibacter rhizovicinus]TCV97521.1 outer membrane autotransporter protein [Luteibacter rhizovicinus]